MTRTRSYGGWIVAIGALCLAACRDSVSPERSLRGAFALRSVDSKPLPLLQYDYSLTRAYLGADTLVFDGRGNLSRVTVSRIDSVQSTYSRVEQTTASGTYRIRNDTIEFPFTCPPGAYCIDPPVGWRLPGGGLVTAYRTTTGFASFKIYEPVR